MVLAPEKKKLLRCPEKALSHRAHQRVWEVGEGSAAGEPASQGHVAVTSRPTQKWHNSKPGTERKPEVLPPTLRQLTQTPSAQSWSQQLLRLGTESLLPPPRLRAVTIIFQDSAVPPLFPRGVPLIQLTLPPQVQPKQVGSEGRKERASNWYYNVHTHILSPQKFPYQDQDKALKCSS